MPSWLIKATIQGVLSLFPQPERINYYFQRYVSKKLQVKDPYIHQKCKHADIYIQHYHDTYNQLPMRVLELGTGWLPIVPIVFSLCDIPEIVSVDIKPLITVTTLYDTLTRLRAMLERNELQNTLHFLSADALDKLDNALYVFNQDQNIEAVLESLNIHSVTTDARALNSSQVGKFDLITSLNTFEHIPPDILADILKAQYHILTENGIIHNHIDLSDHYAHFDHSLTPYHFLRHSPFIWNVVNNKLQYQNRLRISDYRQLYSDAYFEIISEKTSTASDEHISQIQLASAFNDYDYEDIIVIYTEMIGKPLA